MHARGFVKHSTHSRSNPVQSPRWNQTFLESRNQHASYSINRNPLVQINSSSPFVRTFAASASSATQPKKCYPGTSSEFTTSFKFQNIDSVLPTFRLMDETGTIINKELDPQLDKNTVLKMYRSMITLNQMDQILYDVQRQGRVSFYMTNYGEEATHIGSAAALEMNDIIFGQYREAGVFLWRGFTLDEFMNQCYSNRLDYGKGRQMPVHYGSKRLNFQTISSPLATQIPQAVGSAYAQKLMGVKQCTVCYFGEGAASEGDFHAALNFAATLDTPTIFFCRNNRWAISTPHSEQFKSDGIAGRGVSYGVDTIRVDGNDIFAVYHATMQARKKAVQESKPVVIEAMTYRLGHHSTSDDASRYRKNEDVDEWRTNYHPITRLYNYLLKNKYWSEQEDKKLKDEQREEVLSALKRAEAEKKPALVDLFTDVYDTIPQHLLEQQRELHEHIAKYPDHYPIDHHAS